ncbi:MAG: amino acid adenylation domain-containing protein [Acidobacteriota bacterium]
MNRPELTAERFLPHPFPSEAGERVYRTGDVARWLAGGELEYLGRGDQQVKIRGHRIELGEVESALRDQAGISEAAVLARTSNGDMRLVAYVVAKAARTEEAPDEAVEATSAERGELRRALRERLPDYMTPSEYVWMPRLPLTPNGKVDRRALSQVEIKALSAEEARPMERARTPVEEMVTEIWRETLGRKEIGLEENFFELGGHSLLATQVVSRLRGVFGVGLALRALFEHPTVEALASAVEMEKRDGVLTPELKIKPSLRNEAQPLSFAQERLWFLDRLDPDSALYNISAALRVSGRFDLGLLEQAFGEILRRHDALRTVFREAKDGPVQIVQPPQPIQIPVLELRNCPAAERDERARQLAMAEFHQPFDLSEWPLLRVRVIRRDDEEHIILLVMHHIISDGWSMEVLVREIRTLYEAYSRNAASPLAELTTQYADYAVWQREYLKGDVLEEQLDYWTRQLEGRPALLELPTDKPRPAIQSHNGADESVFISEELTAEIKALCRRQETTLFMTLLGAFNVLLYRYSHQTDICVGTPVANRNLTEIENLIGFFVNTLVMRTDLSGAPAFGELLKRVKETALNAYAHQDLPFEKLVEKLSPERSHSYTPLFQVLFNLQNPPKDPLALPGMAFEFLAPEVTQAKYDLIQTIQETGSGLKINLRYNTDIFNQATIRRMLAHYRNLLEAIVAHPECPIDELPLMSAVEKRQALVDWNNTWRDFPLDKRLNDLFEAQAQRTPAAPALLFEEQVLTYEELNRRANQLAHRLRRMGVGPETPVGIMMERSVELIVALFGVLKAGGACVPLDPTYPRQRLDFMLQDARVSVLLAQRRLGDAVSVHSAETLCLDTDWKAIASESDENPAGGAGPDNVAYILYTSGSTGQPKGVLLPHRGLVNRLLAGQSVYHLTESDRLLHKASISFDASIWEIFWPLMAGAQLVLARVDGQRDPAYLARLIAQRGITYVHFIPSMLQLFLQEPGIAKLDSLKGVFCGGEVLSLPLMQRFFESFAANLYNQYGPTETSVNATYFVCQRDDDRQSVPIGRPFPNNQVYILCERMQPAPVGVVGEIFIGGEGISRGYLNRPDLTAEKFIPNPFGSLPGGRLYRTGDLARFCPDGQIEFIGRNDHQVKLRGYRIELGEIEAALRSHPQVRQAVVLVEQAGADKRLTAYVVAREPQSRWSDGNAELREYLRRQLPDFMIPSLFVWLDELPLTPNGKLNRLALASLERRDATPETQADSPVDPIEELLAGIWSQLLNIDRIGRNDNFFNLGGHSLLATQVMTRLREAFGVELPLRSLFDLPTIAALGRAVDAAMREGAGTPDSPIIAVNRARPLPLSFAQRRLWFLDQLRPDSAFYNVPAALHVRGLLDLSALERTLSEIVRRHESLRTVFQERDGEPEQRIESPQPITMPVTDLSGLDDPARLQQVRRLSATESTRPFDLARGPLLRAQALKLGDEEHVILMTMHHIVSDAWSVSVLVNEVAALYEAYRSDEESPLEDLKIQYGDYAVWQSERLSGEMLDSQINYWREQLKGAPTMLALPLDKQRPALQSYRGARHAVLFNGEDYAKLKRLGRDEGVTLFMLLLAAFNSLLYHLTKQSDIVIGADIANRHRGQTEGLIGFFVNMLMMRTKLSGDLTFKQLLASVRDSALEAYANQDAPFEKLVEELRPARDVGYNPLFQVAFVMQNAPNSSLEMDGLTISQMEREVEVAKFDLLLDVTEAEEGLRISFVYATDLWESQSISQMADQLTALLRKTISDPGISLAALESHLDEVDRRRQSLKQEQFQAARLSKLKKSRPQPIEINPVS